MNNTVVSIPL